MDTRFTHATFAPAFDFNDGVKTDLSVQFGIEQDIAEQLPAQVTEAPDIRTIEGSVEGMDEEQLREIAAMPTGTGHSLTPALRAWKRTAQRELRKRGRSAGGMQFDAPGPPELRPVSNQAPELPEIPDDRTWGQKGRSFLRAEGEKPTWVDKGLEKMWGSPTEAIIRGIWAGSPDPDDAENAVQGYRNNPLNDEESFWLMFTNPIKTAMSLALKSPGYLLDVGWKGLVLGLNFMVGAGRVTGRRVKGAFSGGGGIKGGFTAGGSKRIVSKTARYRPDIATAALAHPGIAKLLNQTAEQMGFAGKLKGRAFQNPQQANQIFSQAGRDPRFFPALAKVIQSGPGSLGVVS